MTSQGNAKSRLAFALTCEKFTGDNFMISVELLFGSETWLSSKFLLYVFFPQLGFLVRDSHLKEW